MVDMADLEKPRNGTNVVCSVERKWVFSFQPALQLNVNLGQLVER
jgi:hypothetical protein